jgi:hypothetical protein
MLNSILAHVGSLITGKLAEWAIWLTFGVINLGLSAVLNFALTPLLLRAGLNAEAVARINDRNTTGWFYVTGTVEGFAAILCSLVVFRWLGREPSLLMVVLFVALQLIPLPGFITQATARNMRSASCGAIIGLLAGWWLYYPPAQWRTWADQLLWITQPTPELWAGLTFLFTAFGVRGLSGWTQTNRPIILWKLGRVGNFLHRALFAVIIVGGLSLIVWSVVYAAWWSVVGAFAVAWILVQLSRLSIYAEAIITSVLGPALCSIGIIFLHFVTWLRIGGF